MPNIKARVYQFVQCLGPLVINKATMATFKYDIKYGKRVPLSQATKTQKLKRIWARW